MITEALQHCRGVGPVRLAALHDAGIHSWHDAVSSPDRIPPALRECVVAECRRCLEAFAEDDVDYFVRKLAPQDSWRILERYRNQAAFFDIETTGLEFDSSVTLIVCWHEGRLHTFVEHENLDGFLDLLEDIPLLVSFNGSSFDVPRVLDRFHIPELPCPHLDLRWMSHYRDLRGGLKQITEQLGIARPRDLALADGLLAIQLWDDWQSRRDESARQALIRYCAADVLLMLPLSEFISGHDIGDASELWQHLPDVPCDAAPAAKRVGRRHELSQKFGSASPGRLRTLRPKPSPRGD